MIIYNVTVCVEDDIRDEWVSWMKNKHIPDVMSTNKFISYKMCRVISHSDEGTSYSIQYLCKDMKTLHDYQVNHGPELQKEHTNRYEGKFAAFRTLLELIDEN